MCYSAMVEQDAKKLGLKFKARIQTDLYGDLFSRRLDGEKLYLNKAMEVPFTHKPDGPQEVKIGEKILKWHQEQITKIEADLFTQKKRLADAERILASKPTKKAENDKRIATNKIKKGKVDLERHRSTEIVSESEQRIYPLHYMSMLCLDEKGEKVIMPARYLLRPANKDESFDRKFNGCYNARFDSLDKVAWWKSALGNRHGIILVRKFYENVPTPEYLKKNKLPKGTEENANIVLCFEPDNVEYMFIPTLWDRWQKDGEPDLFSAALITDEPAPEIADAGHDRTPIFLKESAVDAWLKAKGNTVEELNRVLSQREFPHYSHRVLGVA